MQSTLGISVHRTIANLVGLADGVYRVVVKDTVGNILKSEKISKVVN